MNQTAVTVHGRQMSCSVDNAHNITADDEETVTEESIIVAVNEEVDADDKTVIEQVEEVDIKMEEVIEEDPVPCTLCGQILCDWESFGEEIWEECEGLKDQGADNKQVRFHAYKLYMLLRHGVLHRFDCRPLPVCVRGEIMDS